MARYAQFTQSLILFLFAISLQYLQKEVNVIVDFLHADKHDSFLQSDTMIFDGNG